MDITQQMLGAVPVVRISGDLDHMNAPALENVLRVHLRTGDHRLLLDLAGCSYIDSGGLAVIMSAIGELRDDGLLAIVAPSLSIRRLLDVVGLYDHKRCAIFKAEPEALLAILALSPGAIA